MSDGRAAVFLDRDGVLNVKAAPHQYVRGIDELQLLPGVPEALSLLARNGYTLVVVSNQRGIARGLVSWRATRDIEDHIRDASGCDLHFYYCPHSIEAACPCRKPQPGMLLRAAHDHHIDLSVSTMVGDAESDVLAGISAGTRTILLRAGLCASLADRVAPDLGAAAELIVTKELRSSRARVGEAGTVHGWRGRVSGC